MRSDLKRQMKTCLFRMTFNTQQLVAFYFLLILFICYLSSMYFIALPFIVKHCGTLMALLIKLYSFIEYSSELVKPPVTKLN